MNIDMPKLVWVLCGTAVIIGTTTYFFEYGFRNAGRTKKNYMLRESHVFRIQIKQLVYSNLLVLCAASWLIGTILFFESLRFGFFKTIDEWKGLFLFIICFFAVIDLLLNIVLSRTFFRISPKEIEYRFDFNKRKTISINDIQSIFFENEQWRIILKVGKIIDIPKGSFLFIRDSDELEKLLKELSNTICQQH